MKVLYVLHTTVMGGATISFLNMVRGLREKGVELVVAVPIRDESFFKAIEEMGGRCYKTAVVWSTWQLQPDKWKQSYGVMLTLLLKMYALVRLLRMVLRERPDIIHTNTGVVHEAFRCAQLTRIPHVWHLREYQDRDFNLHFLPSKRHFSSLLRKSNVVSITRDILQSFGIEEDSSHRVIYNGILPQAKVAMSFPKEHYFLCSSRISQEKGHDDVVSCFAEFYREHRDYRLVILGFGVEEYIEKLKRMAKELGCSDAVEFAGFQKDVTPYMRKAKALIVASHNEGFGRMTAEAAFCGCLVIGRNTSGTKEILDVTGGLPFMTNDEMLAAMRQVAEMSEEEYCEMATVAQRQAVAMYSNESNVENIYNMYEQIMTEKGSRCCLKAAGGKPVGGGNFRV